MGSLTKPDVLRWSIRLGNVEMGKLVWIIYLISSSVDFFMKKISDNNFYM